MSEDAKTRSIKEKEAMDRARANFRLRNDRLNKSGVQLEPGNQYYEVDRGYDKNFYENDLNNWFKVFGAFILFYTFNILHFWGVFELGVAETEKAMIYQIVVFSFTVFVGACMLISGSISNEIKSQYDFLCEVLDKKKQEESDKAKIARRAQALQEKNQGFSEQPKERLMEPEPIYQEEAKDDDEDKDAGVAIIDGNEPEDANILGDKEAEK